LSLYILVPITSINNFKGAYKLNSKLKIKQNVKKMPIGVTKEISYNHEVNMVADWGWIL
jgi:hypothetical protein